MVAGRFFVGKTSTDTSSPSSNSRHSNHDYHHRHHHHHYYHHHHHCCCCNHHHRQHHLVQVCPTAANDPHRLHSAGLQEAWKRTFVSLLIKFQSFWRNIPKQKWADFMADVKFKRGWGFSQSIQFICRENFKLFYFTFLKKHLLRFVISFLCSVFWICTYSYIMVNFFRSMTMMMIMMMHLLLYYGKLFLNLWRHIMTKCLSVTFLLILPSWAPEAQSETFARPYRP